MYSPASWCCSSHLYLPISTGSVSGHAAHEAARHESAGHEAGILAAALVVATIASVGGLLVCLTVGAAVGPAIGSTVGTVATVVAASVALVVASGLASVVATLDASAVATIATVALAVAVATVLAAAILLLLAGLRVVTTVDLLAISARLAAILGVDIAVHLGDRLVLAGHVHSMARQVRVRVASVVADTWGVSGLVDDLGLWLRLRFRLWLRWSRWLDLNLLLRLGSLDLEMLRRGIETNSAASNWLAHVIGIEQRQGTSKHGLSASQVQEDFLLCLHDDLTIGI